MSRLFPAYFWRRSAAQAHRLGLDRLYLILSFDCDTPEDIDAVLRMEPYLKGHGIKTTYAVPGALLERTPDAYRGLAEGGADFINHGARPHAEYRGGRYWSVNFYDRMTPAEVVEDIRAGHEIVTRVAGRAPRGFRAPHFGSFQSPAQLELQYRTLVELGYVYSTSTVPRFGFERGPAWNAGEIVEIPLSGSMRRPLTVLDSWGHVISPHTPQVQASYAEAFMETVAFFLADGSPGCLNYYADPSHVYPSDPFEKVVNFLVEQKVQTLHYEDLLALVAASL
ncbi:MAG: hypothetical protein A3F84_23060 [Candidatus Handelsmanbacteria bacterium RIFCSPLOWO2_12_FULL_64_10]|uniref:NodB homology domain-containing protein n=1 Tax=Handelsmanbacteria sp. (strain RIFCSPLOWO2_12_FULL_64_10) TaxID=1817868 RepID=A0A1F6CG96_HANXR|nr:MAG: hypothetical protein A3F84_23060 [Candidatus Handelsmanbacteria bacterium RIFCSPLOWO2_12_FULL_64_10]